MAAVTRRLPFGLASIVAPSIVGYVLINLCTFVIDLTLLDLFHGVARLPLPIAVTLSFGTAAAVSYVANRVLNFRSHGAVGKQLVIFVAIEVSNYFIFVLGLTDALASIGVFYELARVIAACCEGVYLYCGMHWLVFRDVTSASANAPDDGQSVDTPPEELSPEELSSEPEPAAEPDAR
jgi:putative flippase GtrA